MQCLLVPKQLQTINRVTVIPVKEFFVGKKDNPCNTLSPQECYLILTENGQYQNNDGFDRYGCTCSMLLSSLCKKYINLGITSHLITSSIGGWGSKNKEHIEKEK